MEPENSIIKVAIVSKDLAKNGISSVIINYAERINPSKFELTIFAGEVVDENNKKILEKKGIRVIKLPCKENKLDYYRKLYKTMKKNYFDILHVHGNSTAMSIELFIGILKNIKIRIAHCHNSKKDKSIIKKIIFPIFNRLYTNAFACGELAGKTLFGNRKFFIMRNGINTIKYQYNEQIRNEERKKLNVSNKIVLGHIGRFNSQKNHKFLIDLFENIARENDKYVLLLIGNGPDYEKIKERIDNSKYKDRIILYGETNEPEKMYLAMDIFVFPSLYEGLPLTLVEAQISGLNCVISDTITDEVIIDNVEKLPLNDIKKWKNVILNKKINYMRENFYSNNIIRIKEFDINDCVIDLEEKYNYLTNNNKGMM